MLLLLKLLRQRCFWKRTLIVLATIFFQTGEYLCFLKALLKVLSKVFFRSMLTSKNLCFIYLQHKLFIKNINYK